MTDENNQIDEAAQRETAEARFDEVVMTLAGILGRQLAREHFNATSEAAECARLGAIEASSTLEANPRTS